jgi:thioredoxin 1
LSTPVVKEVMKVFANQMDTVEVCTDDLPDVCADAGVVSIPTIQMYYRGKLMDTIVGCVAKSVLSSAVEKVMEDAAVQFGVRNDPGTDDQQQES